MKRKDWILFVLLSLFFAAIVYVVYGFYVGSAHYVFPPIGAYKGAELGQLGDYFGGLLNPIIGLVTVCFVFFTFRMQRHQLELAKKEHQLLLLRDEFGRVYDGLIADLGKSGIDIGNELFGEISADGRDRGFAVTGSLDNKFHFSYSRLFQYFLRVDISKKNSWLKLFRVAVEKDSSHVNKMINLCLMAKAANCLAEQILLFVDAIPAYKLSIDQQIKQAVEVFECLGVDYLSTSDDGGKIVWINVE